MRKKILFWRPFERKRQGGRLYKKGMDEIIREEGTLLHKKNVGHEKMGRQKIGVCPEVDLET